MNTKNNKIIYLILILVCVTLLSSIVSYEHFTSIFKIRFNNEDGYEMENKFPKQNLSLDGNGKLCIQVLNNTPDGAIYVWLDDLPMCDRWIQEDEEGELLEDPTKITREINENNGAVEKDCGYYNGDMPTKDDEERNGDNWEVYIDKMTRRYTSDKDKDKIPRFLIINDDGSIYWDSLIRKTYDGTIKKKDIKRFFKLETGQILRVIPPHKNQNIYNFESEIPNDGKNIGFTPYMCFLQMMEIDKSKGDRGISYGSFDTQLSKGNLRGATKNCGGSGIYITDDIDIDKAGQNVTTKSISRVEYNINNGEIYFNFSGVDGSNMNYTANYDLRDSNGQTITNTLCHGKDNIQCDTNINVNDLASDNIYKKLANNLFFNNGNPYISSIISPKAFYSDKGSLYYNKDTEGKYIDDLKCLSPIQFSENTEETYDNWTYWEKAIYSLRVYTPKPTASNIFIFDGSKIKDGKPTTLFDIRKLEFNMECELDGNLKADKSRSIINDHNCAECPYACGINKAIAHIWWGLNENQCAKDYTSLIRNMQNGKIGCNQYTWAYGEMGYDILNGDLNNMIDKGILIYTDFNGNPQKGEFCKDEDERKESCKDKSQYDIPKDNNKESVNKPLLKCDLPNKSLARYKDLKQYPVNINISINNIIRKKYERNSVDDKKCKETPRNQPCIDGDGNSSTNNILQCFQNLDNNFLWCGDF